jgi:hypothetical protein
MTADSTPGLTTGRLERTLDAPAELIIDVEPAGDRTRVVMTIDPLHGEPWTQGYRAHRANELQNLEAAIRRPTS